MEGREKLKKKRGHAVKLEDRVAYSFFISFANVKVMSCKLVVDRISDRRKEGS